MCWKQFYASLNFVLPDFFFKSCISEQIMQFRVLAVLALAMSPLAMSPPQGGLEVSSESVSKSSPMFRKGNYR
jgi:hypothetical protein